MEFDHTVATTKTNQYSSPEINHDGPINLYRTPPDGHLTLEECQDLFRQRLEALHVFEQYPDFLSKDNKDLVKSGIEQIKSHVFKTNCIKSNQYDKERQRLDHSSHMLVRMYCIRDPNLWGWFKSTERRLLHYRLLFDMILTADQLGLILQSFRFKFERVPFAEVPNLKKEHVIGWNLRDKGQEEVFKVHFTNALKFISKRSVALKEGYAFLTRSEIIILVCDIFEKHLESELNYGSQHLNLSLPQVQHLLDSLEVVYLDYDEKVTEYKRKLKQNDPNGYHNTAAIDVDDIEDLSKNHFPPCMRYLYESLKEDNHLKHMGRVLFASFLRSGGVPMDSAIDKIFRPEFTKKITNEKFKLNYEYNFRHIYGKEGHKKALSCFSCDKMINDNPPGPTDKHGCPFKHFDSTRVRAMMANHGLKANDIESIMMRVDGKEYKSACSLYFEFQRGYPPSEPIRIPVQFYYQSRILANMPPPPLENQGGEENHGLAITEGNLKEATTVPSYADEDSEMGDDF